MIRRIDIFKIIQCRTFLWAMIVWAALFLSACAKAPSVQVTKLTLAQIRQNYIKDLQESGVQVIKLGETYRFVLLSDNLFNSGSANIQEDYRPILRTLAQLMNTYDKVNVLVASYTDDTSAIQQEQALTTRQAQVVSSYLWSQGIDARLEYAIGYNRENSVSWNGSLMGQHFNRRVEVSFRFYPETNPYA